MAVKTKPKRSTKREPLLPEKLSDCLAVALGDLIKCERQKRTYEIDMCRWHSPNGRCSVCLAGSVMAQTLGADPKDYKHFTHYDEHNKRRLGAISNCAVTSLWSGVAYFAGDCASAAGFDRGRTPRYDHDPKAFKAAIRSYIKQLRAKGL